MTFNPGGKWILGGEDGRTPEPCEDLLQWGRMFEDTAKRVVAKDSIGEVRISTIFLGLDHSFGGGSPLLFETMIFEGKHDQYCERCSTWAEAEAQHARAVRLVKETSP